MSERERESADKAVDRGEPAEAPQEDPETPDELETSEGPGELRDSAGPDEQKDPAASGEGADGGSVRRGRVAVAVGVFGELLITAGLVLALFVVYSLWWTNVLADRQAKKESDRVREHWAADRGPGDLDTRDGIGFLHVPSMSEKDILVKKGTDPKELNQGIAGYYTKPVKSALPQDQSGNFSLAAHRDGHGAKFHDIDKIDKGDAIVFETKNTWYVYKVFETLPQTSKYNVDVLDAVPKGSGKKARGRYITLTTCTPVYTSKYRYIVWGELVRTQDVDEDRTAPAELR
ncbi:class E sortase [Streptomyces diacarni]|uniref:Class E sortase n=1 Tax=Streptomyces diacarni TaxID=2800381 RepID=A0A367E8B7_9ACTN|nr:class E sortase [Streptomyces diacarni]RCG14288.1 class E sortase [Streptomyces diacarni]